MGNGEECKNGKNESLFCVNGRCLDTINMRRTVKPMTQPQALPVSSMRYAERKMAPDWWFYRFEPVWRPFIQRLCRQKSMTLLEFERAASQVPGLTHIEKTIALSAFRQQQEQGLVPLRDTTAFRSEHNLSAV
jgi:hypothetical protein